jgi:hypothetical protein
MKSKNGKKSVKRTYYLPPKLLKVFKEWCSPGRDYSPKIAGAIFLYMLIGGNVRERCEKLAYSEYVEKSLKEFRSLLGDDIVKIESSLLNNDILEEVKAVLANYKQTQTQSFPKSI